MNFMFRLLNGFGRQKYAFLLVDSRILPRIYGLYKKNKGNTLAAPGGDALGDKLKADYLFVRFTMKMLAS